MRTNGVHVLALLIGVTSVGMLAGALAVESVANRPAPFMNVVAAQTDEQWISLIQQARAARGNRQADWPLATPQAGVVVVRRCEDIPTAAELIDAAIEHSPDESRRRVILNYGTDQERYQLVVEEGDDTRDCGADIVKMLSGADTRKAAVDAHICAQMQLMAAGEKPTDVTLRPASVRVANAYLDALCGNVAVPPSELPWPEAPVQEGVKVVRACTDVPTGAEQVDAAIEHNPEVTQVRVLVNYRVPANGDRYQLILYGSGSYIGCDHAVQALLADARP